MNPIPDRISRFAAAVGPQSDEVLETMDDYAVREEFPTVGPAVGGWLQLLAELVDAERVFEFGSGFGYSAYWFAQALPDDGRIVLTEIDADELAMARDFLDRGGFADRAAFEHGDAVEIAAAYDGTFDVALIDNEKTRYVDAFEAIRDSIRTGGLVIADNAVAGASIDFGQVLASVADGTDVDFANENTRGVVEYLERVHEDDDFETGVIPVGEGITVSYRRA
jgi:predicted O-methyltransferase YrrM